MCSVFMLLLGYEFLDIRDEFHPQSVRMLTQA